MATLRQLFGMLLGALLIGTTAIAVPMHGTYTIGDDLEDSYASITAAVAALIADGVDGAVIFDVEELTYSSGSVLIGAITGASATNTITFRDEVPGGTRPVLSSNAAPALDLSGADYIIFDGIDITLTINGMVVRITGNADYNTIKNCLLTGASESGSGNYGVYITGGGNDYNVIESATVSRSAYYGVRMSGVSGTRDQGNEVRECTLIGGRYSVYVNYQNGAVVRGCDIQPGYDALSSAFYGIYVTSQTAGELCVAYGNEIHNIRGSGASYAIYVAPGTGGLFKAYNNFVYDFQVTGSNAAYGLYAASGSPEFYFNSIYIGDVAGSGLAYGFYQGGSSTAGVLKNNIFELDEPTTACWAIYRYQGTLTSDYNCVYSAGPGALYNMGRDGSTNYATLALWQAATSRDLNSLEGNPGFISATNLHISADSGLVHLRGIPIAGITDDIDGDTRLSLPDIGADEYVYNAPGADYWVRELLGWTYLTPELTALTTDAVVVNRGSAAQESVLVVFFYDGLPQDTEYVSLNASAADTVTFNWTSPAAPDTILLEAQSFLVSDAVPENDSATATVQIVAPPMSGTYTIGDDLEDNYASFTAAVAALAVRGVDGAVIFDVEALTYNEAVTIGQITGASPTWTITFREAPAHLDTPPEIVTDVTPALNLSGANYIIFDNIDITLTVTGKVVQITGNADYNTIKNCLLTGASESSTSSYGVHVTGGGNDYNVIENVTATSSVHYPVYLDGASGALDQGNQVRSCTFSGGRHSVNLKYQNGAVVRDCDLQPGRDANTGDLAGIYATSLGGGTCTVYGNKIHNLRGRGSMMGIYASGMGSGSILKAYNNFIYDFQGSGTWTEDNLVCGLRMATSGAAEFYFNTVHIGDVQMPYLVCGYHQSASATTVQLKNNVFRVDEPTTNCWGIYVASGTPTLNSDYNAFYSAGPSAVYNMAYAAATNYPNLASWQGGTGRDPSSVEGDPGFMSASDLHIQPHYSLLNAAGLAIAGVTTDIDNDGRGSPPDIGADEYAHTPMAHDYGVKKWVGWTYQYTSNVPVVIQAEVKNYGTNAETDVPVRLFYQGIQQDEVLLSLNSGQAQTVDLDWTPPVVDVELGILEVQAFCPSDTFLQNDSLKGEVAVIGGPLSGPYNVGGGSPMDFPTIKAAVTALALVGVNGPVTFNVYPLTYLGPIVIDSVAGASATNTITFREAPAHLDTPPELVSGPAPALKLNKADYITFDGIDITALGNGAVVVITGNADYNAIKNCLITGSGDVSSVYSFGIDVSSSAANLGDDYNVIENVTINNTVSTCVRLGYGSTPGGQGNVVRNCTIIGGQIGVELTYQNEAVVCYNDIQPGYAGSTANNRGIYVSSTNLGALNTAYGNRIHNLRGIDVFGIYSSPGSPPRQFRAYNNFVYDFQCSGRAVGLLAYMGVSEFYFNSVHMGDVATGDTCFGFYQKRATTIATTALLKNNIFQIDEPTTPCYGIYQQAGTLASDYNCFYGTGLAYIMGRDSLTGIDYATLALWQAGTPYDDNSLEGNPGFIDSANLHIDSLVTLVDSAGTPIDGITDDIDGQLRNVAFPDIGADEYNAAVPPPEAVDSLTVFPDTDAGDAVLRWAPSAEANSYKVYRGNDYGFVIDGTTYIGQTAGTTYTDVGVLATAGEKYYVVLASTDIIARGR